MCVFSLSLSLSLYVCMCVRVYMCMGVCVCMCVYVCMSMCAMLETYVLTNLSLALRPAVPYTEASLGAGYDPLYPRHVVASRHPSRLLDRGQEQSMSELRDIFTCQ